MPIPSTRDHLLSMSRALLRAAVVLLAVLLAACEGTSDPVGVEGTYSLHTVNGARAPVPVTTHPMGGVTQVLDADVRLRGNGVVSVELTTRVVDHSGVTGPEERVTYEGTFEQRADVLLIRQMEPVGGRGPDAVNVDGVVISPREIAVTMQFAVASYAGFYTYPVSIIARR
jgi:hypothetical protein